MSKRLVKTTLPRYDGPVRAADALQSLFDESPNGGTTGHILEKVSQKIRGYKCQTRPTTVDGYGWFWGQHFQTDSGGEVAILIPWAQDWDKTDGSSFDRAIAVYTMGDVAEIEISYIQAKLIIGLCEFFTSEAKSAQSPKAHRLVA